MVRLMDHVWIETESKQHACNHHASYICPRVFIYICTRYRRYSSLL